MPTTNEQKGKSAQTWEENVLAMLDSTYRIAAELRALQLKLNWYLVFGIDNPIPTRQLEIPNLENSQS